MMIASLLALLGVHSASAAEDVRRPTQYVAFAFDGSQNLSFWKDSREFAADLKKKNIPFGFTYFISGVYFLGSDSKNLYEGPHHPVGHSDIGFGTNQQDILARIGEVNAAYREGNEIGSHANGHFDGHTWSESDWGLEFALFNHLIFGAFQNNHLQTHGNDPTHWEITEKNIEGFRAPLLGTSPGLFTTLHKDGFRYDTSRVAPMSYWPEKIGGMWNFPLAEVTIAGTAKHTLSMDYNFYVSQSGAKSEPQYSDLFERQMIDTYRQYFMANYNGNRAPVHIGHHFAQWNGGAYWRAMREFANEVCGLPEVRCVTYRELADLLDQAPAEKLAAYRQSRFEKGTPLKLATTSGKPLHLSLNMVQSSSGEISATVSGPEAEAALKRGLKVSWKVQSNTTSQERRVSAVAKLNGIEVSRSTHLLRMNEEDGTTELSPDDLESQALMGDLPAAHNENE